jgi:chromosome segregation ATPase
MAKAQPDIAAVVSSLATLTERLDNALKNIDSARSSQEELVKIVSECEKQLAVQRHQIDDLRRDSEELRRRRWGLSQALFMAIVGGVVALFCNWLLAQLKKP